MKQVRRLMVAAATLAALAIAPGSAVADTVVQNQNSSQDAYAESGDAEAHNDAEVQAGPRADGAGGNAQASQVGDNDVDVRQRSRARSGDAVAGGQVTGVSGGGRTTIQNQNSSDGDTAVTGSAFASNVVTGTAGPVADSMFGGSQASQTGSNSIGLDQLLEASTGDAVSGSQVTGLVV